MRRLTLEFRATHAALIYFTRLPLPLLPGANAADWQRAATYFPLAGWVVGGVSAGVWWAGHLVLPPGIASGLSLLAGVVLTGAMHEDGFADVCDGFGGGTTRDDILGIMRDSRVGAYGVIGLILLLGLKWQTIAVLPPALVPAALVAGHALSRGTAITLMATLDYARTEGKARPLASRLPPGRVALAVGLSLVPLACLPARFWWPTLAVVAVRAGAAAWFRRHLGGYTGDCLGATQQVAELAFLLPALALT